MDFTANDMPPQDAAAARNTEDTPLTTILDLLQGEDHECPDAALARLPADHLHRIATAAQRNSQDCLDLIRCLVDCTGMLLMRKPTTDACDRALHLNLHLATLLDDHQRWDDLRENADCYRHQPDIAQRVAT